MKHLQWLLATACMLAVCLSVSAQSGKKVKSISPEKWVKSKVWSEGLKAKPHSSTNLAEFKAQYEANPEQWKAAFRWLASHDLTTIEKGKHPIEGTSLVVSVEDSKNEPLEKRTSESHRKHIDLQYVVTVQSEFAYFMAEGDGLLCAHAGNGNGGCLIGELDGAPHGFALGKSHAEGSAESVACSGGIHCLYLE